MRGTMELILKIDILQYISSNRKYQRSKCNLLSHSYRCPFSNPYHRHMTLPSHLRQMYPLLNHHLPLLSIPSRYIDV